MSEQKIMDHHLVEFISKPELVSVLIGLNQWGFIISEGDGYVSMSLDGLKIFFVAKEGSFYKEWNDANCSDHLVLQAYKNGISWSRYEYSLYHMKCNGFGLRKLIAHELRILHDLFVSQQSARQAHSRIQLQIQESALVGLSSRKRS